MADKDILIRVPHRYRVGFSTLHVILKGDRPNRILTLEGGTRLAPPDLRTVPAGLSRAAGEG